MYQAPCFLLGLQQQLRGIICTLRIPFVSIFFLCPHVDSGRWILGLAPFVGALGPKMSVFPKDAELPSCQRPSAPQRPQTALQTLNPSASPRFHSALPSPAASSAHTALQSQPAALPCTGPWAQQWLPQPCSDLPLGLYSVQRSSWFSVLLLGFSTGGPRAPGEQVRAPCRGSKGVIWKRTPGD